MSEKRGKRELTTDERAKVFKALSDPSRVAIVDTITKQGAMCGTELSEKLGISLALICHHWDVLIEAGLVHKERIGQAQYCSIDLAKLEVATAGWGAGRGERGVRAKKPKKPKKPKKKSGRAKKSATGRAS